MELHKDMKKITVVVSRKRLVRVHPLPASVTDFGQVKICTSQQVYMDAICFSCSSKRAHSIGELLYWHWQIAKKRIFEKVSLCTITYTTMDTLHVVTPPIIARGSVYTVLADSIQER